MKRVADCLLDDDAQRESLDALIGENPSRTLAETLASVTSNEKFAMLSVAPFVLPGWRMIGVADDAPHGHECQA